MNCRPTRRLARRSTRRAGPVVLREDLDILALLTDTDAIEPVTRAGNEGYALRDVMAHAGVAEACLGAGYDCALLPRTRSLDRCASSRWTWTRH
jgi:hypothetical protein